MTSISIVDISKISLNKPDPTVDDYKEVSLQIKKCFEEIGFMYISHHGIDQEVITEAMKASMDFFKLEESVKNKTRKGEEYQGWVEQGREIFDQDSDGNVAELEVRETYDLKNISSAGIFPDKDCPQLRQCLVRLSSEAKLLSRRLMKSISLSLGCDLQYLDSVHVGMLTEGIDNSTDNATTLRSIHYPPIPDDLKDNASIIRCGEHSDYGTITLLFQDELGGLEVKDVEGRWIDAKPVPGTILVNVGDLLEAVSGGKFPSTRHRVMVPESEFRRRTLRQSMAFFVHPDDAVVCEPLSGPDPRYPPVTARQHLENRFAATYAGGLA